MGGPAIINGEEHQEFDNMYKIDFKFDGEVWKSVEQLFQSFKFEKGSEGYIDVLKSDPDISWKLGNRVDIPIRKDWEEVKVDVMEKCVRAKFDSHKELQEKLKRTKGKIVFVESSHFWNKHNALILEKIRSELYLE